MADDVLGFVSCIFSIRIMIVLTHSKVLTRGTVKNCEQRRNNPKEKRRKREAKYWRPVHQA